MDVGPRRPVEVSHGHEQCEYWITPEFQTCLILNDRSHQTNVFLDKGLFYERGENGLASVGLWYSCGVLQDSHPGRDLECHYISPVQMQRCASLRFGGCKGVDEIGPSTL